MTDITVKVLLCRDGSKHDIQISQDATLSDLKTNIGTTPSITRSFGGQSALPRYQRLFYFGRELKSSKRSLSALGLVSRNLPLLIHCHSTQPKVVSIDGADATSSCGRSSSKPAKRNSRTKQRSGQCDSDNNEDDDDDIQVLEEVRYSGHKRMNPAGQSGMGMRGMGIGVSMAMGLGAAIGISSASSATNPTNSEEVILLDSDDDDDDIEVIEATDTKRARRG